MPQQSIPIKDIHLPADASWWPPALGWWLLLALCGLLFIIFIFLKKRHQKRLLKKSISKEFDAIKHRFNQHHDHGELARQLSAFMRRICIQYFDRKTSASLTGDSWLILLDKLNHSSAFSSGAGRILLDAPYRPQSNFDAKQLLALCHSCIQQLPDTPTTLKLDSSGNQDA